MIIFFKIPSHKKKKKSPVLPPLHRHAWKEEDQIVWHCLYNTEHAPQEAALAEFRVGEGS